MRHGGLRPSCVRKRPDSFHFPQLIERAEVFSPRVNTKIENSSWIFAAALNGREEVGRERKDEVGQKGSKGRSPEARTPRVRPQEKVEGSRVEVR